MDALQLPSSNEVDSKSDNSVKNVICSKSKGIKKNKTAKVVAEKSSNRKQKKKEVEQNLIDKRNAKRKNKDILANESKDSSQVQGTATDKSQLKYSQTQQGTQSEQELIDSKFTEKARISNKTDKSKYYQNFDFFFKRTCFRVMTEFYKDKFNSFYQKRMA